MRKLPALRFLFAFSLAVSLSGCPPPCTPSESLRVDEMDMEVIGKWSGKTKSPTGQELYSTFTFRDDGTFLLEFYIGEGQTGIIKGDWGTKHFDQFDARMDLAIGCTNFADLQDETYRVWNYAISGQQFTAGKPADFTAGPDDPNRTGAFYELNRVE